MTTIHDDWDDKTPAESVGAATKLAHRAAKHARAADQRTLEILGGVQRIEKLGEQVFAPRSPRSKVERYAMTLAVLVIAACGLLYLARIAMAMP